MEQLLEKYLPGYKADKSVNEANRAVRLERKHFDWLINLLASTLETIKASDISKKAAIEVFANGLEGTNSNFNRERFVRDAYSKILKDEVNPEAAPKKEENPPEKQMRFEESTLDEKKKKKPMKKCVDCGAGMPDFFTKCPECGAKQEAAPKDGEVKKDEKKTS